MDQSDVIFVDHSILSTFATCEEKARLAYVEHLQPKEEAPPLVFGSAFHAAVASYYTDGDKDKARAAFLADVKGSGPDSLPISADSDEKRSVERGLYLIDAYIERWRPIDINWSDVLRPDTQEPYVEIGFAIYFMDWHGVPVVCAGKVDRVRRYRVDDQIYGWETKTTGGSATNYPTRPNHQLTIYKWALRELLQLNVAGMILDIIHVSDRKIGGKFPNGIDVEKDFNRIETRRSDTDVEEMLYDLRRKTTQFLTLRESRDKRWHRNAPAACYMYGGCHFRDICNSNLNPTIISSKYQIKRWEPWLINGTDVTKSSLAI